MKNTEPLLSWLEVILKVVIIVSTIVMTWLAIHHH